MGTNLGDLLSQAGLKASESGASSEPAASPAPNASEPRYGAKVVVRRTKKGRGGRTVTLVQGITEGHDAVAKQLKKQLGAGVRVEDDEVVVQGDQVERVARWLESQGVKKVVRS